MRTRSRSILTSFLVILLALAVLPATSADIKLTHLTYSSHGENWQAFLALMGERFKASTGISVEVVIAAGTAGYRTKLLTMIAGGVPPDVTDAHPQLAAPLVAQGVFEDLWPYVKRDKFPIDQIPPVAIAGVTTPNGALWGIPVSVLPIVTFFNADMFAESGLANPRELGDRWNWDAATASARALTRDRDGDGRNDIYGTSRISYRWEMQVHQAGGQLYDRVIFPTKSRLNSPEVIRAVEFIANFYTQDLVSNTHTTYNVNLGTAGFAVVDGPSSAMTFRDVTFNWDIAMQPKGPANRAARVNPDGFQVVSQSAHKDAAWQWVRFLTSSVDNQLELSRLSNRMPSLREAMVRYTRLPGLNLPSNWQALIDTSFNPDGYGGYMVADATSVDAVVNPIMADIWAGKIAPAVGLQKAHDVVSGLLK